MKRLALHRSAHGFVLLLIILSILTMGAISLLVVLGSTATNSSRRLQQNASEDSKLQAAKQALVGYMLSPPPGIGNIRPGMLPIPDSLANGIYDGKEDNQCLGNTTNGLPGVGATSIVKRCLGKFPWKVLGLDIGNPADHDPMGEVPWLAVSANLVSYDSCLTVLNSDVANLNSPVSSTCAPSSWPYPQPTILPHPWLSVFDQSGNLLSDKVAALLIMPGAPIATETRGQVRMPSSVGNPSDYLDSINLPLGCATGCTAFDNAGLNNKFVMIPPGTRYPETATNAAVRGQLVPFNDNLIYITIDELMYYIERRVVGEMASSMQTFRARSVTTGLKTYPWLQPLSTTFADSTSLYPQANTVFGVLPFLTEYSGATNLPMYRTSFNWTLSGSSESTYWQTVSGGGVSSVDCYRISSTPSLYVRNPLIGTLNATTLFGGPFANSAAAVISGTCKWLGTTQIYCEQDLGAADIPVGAYASAALCTSQTGPIPVTLSVAKKIILSSDCKPSGTVTSNYTNATASAPHKWSWSCNNSNVADAIEVRYTVSNSSSTTYNLLPRQAKLTSGGTNQNLAVNDMFYSPIMPSWFYDNRWYLTTFAALAPSQGAAPATPSPNPCGLATTLTLDGVSATAIAMTSGRKFSTQTRPSGAVVDYLESTNANGGSTCSFNNFASPNASTFNDSLLSVSP